LPNPNSEAFEVARTARYILLLALSLCPVISSSARAQSPDAGDAPRVVGPTQILYADADTVFIMRSREWWSAAVPHREKLLLHGIRMKYWRDRIPADMRLVFDELGYPTGRVLHMPVGHTEEWWYYDALGPPLRFRDGVLLDRDRFDALRAER
jgi:hypothetical protein